MYLTRPRRIGFGDAGDGFDFSTPIDVPTTSSGAIDWGSLALPPAPDMSPLTAPAAASSWSPAVVAPNAPNFADLAASVVKGAQTYYGAQTAVNQANYQSQLAKAQAQAAINIAKAGGQAATRTAGAGTPSPTLLLVAGLGLAAALLLKK